VLCADSFHRYTNTKTVPSEMHRVLKPNGRLVLADKIHPFGFFRFLNILLYFVWSDERRPYRRKPYTKKEITALAVRSDFGVSDFILVGRTAFVMTAVALMNGDGAPKRKYSVKASVNR
jgi:SAM-dependent methyltransferase